MDYRGERGRAADEMVGHGADQRRVSQSRCVIFKKPKFFSRSDPVVSILHIANNDFPILAVKNGPSVSADFGRSALPS
jgi:hypothetical protein